MAVSSFSYFMPLLAFILVFVVTYALLAKTKILGGNNFMHLFTSFIIAIIFIAAPSAQKLAMISAPWFAVLIIMVFIILLLLTFVRGKVDDLVQSPAVALALIGIVILIFVIASINVFGPAISPYLPGGNQTSMTSQTAQTVHFFSSPAVIGAIILLIIAAVASWIMTKS